MVNSKKRFVIRLKRNDEKIRLVTFFAFLAMACMPFSTINIFGFGILFLIGAPLLILSMPILIKSVQKTMWDKATVLLALFFAFGILGYAWTPSFSVSSLYNYIKNVAIVTCLYCQPFNKREQRFLLNGSIIACLIVCWFLLTGNNIGYEDGRATIAIFGEIQDPNYIGFVFLAPLAVALQYILNEKTAVFRMLYIAFSIVILYCVLLTGSRGALLACAVVVMVAVTMKFRKIWTAIAFCAIILVLVLGIFDQLLLLLPREIALRFSIQKVLETGGTGRTDIWLKTLQIMKESPHMLLLGFGSSSSQAVLGCATHNFLLQLLLEVGVVGTTLFLNFFWIWCKRLLKQNIMCLSIILGCMALAMSLSVNTNFYFWMTMTLGIVCLKANLRNDGDCRQ